MLVSDVTPADVIAILAPIWCKKAETARRILLRMELVLANVRAHPAPVLGRSRRGVSGLRPAGRVCGSLLHGAGPSDCGAQRIAVVTGCMMFFTMYSPG